jgi:hypothetical protein
LNTKAQRSQRWESPPKSAVTGNIDYSKHTAGAAVFAATAFASFAPWCSNLSCSWKVPMLPDWVLKVDFGGVGTVKD